MSRSRTSRRRRRHWGRFLLFLLFASAALYAGVHCFFRAPDPAPEGVDPEQEAELSHDPEEEALRSHMARKENFYTILLSGLDDHNGGSDTNILLAVDVDSGSMYGVSIPRDTKILLDGKSYKFNYAYNSGGIDLMAETLTHQLGVPVDHTMQVDLKGFVELVDAIGGVQFDVPVDMHYEDPYQDLSIHISKGPQLLTGRNALKVVRFRSGYASQDIGRMATQQAFLKAAAKQMLKPSNFDKLDDYMRIFRTYVETDLSLGNLAWLGSQAINMGPDAIEFSTLPGEWHKPYIYLDSEAVLELVNEHLNPYLEDRVPEDLNIPGR